MGAARRERLRLAKERMKLVRGGKQEEADEVVIPPAVKPPELTTLTLLLPKLMVEAINELHGFVKNHFPSRNDFLRALLEAGLHEAATAYEAAKEAREKAEKPMVELAKPGASAEEISARLRALRGEPPTVG